jgi:16S rRNA (cytidine1402-2'-O)-methyltransferase
VASESAGQDAQGAAQHVSPGALYVVATPVGNLADMTARARDVLLGVDRIVAEDTRVTAKLLAHYGIAKRASALHAHNEARRVDELVRALASGESVALVSDAGTPAISDPGARIVRAAHEAGRPVIPIPGACALAAAVSAAGLVAERFVFVGFLPLQAKARRALLDTLSPLPFAVVVYEAPHRVRQTVRDLADALGPQRELVVARELTKRFEEVVRMRAVDADAWFAADANRERGEFVLVVDAGAPREVAVGVTTEVDAWLRSLVAELPAAAAARVAAAATGIAREVLYARASELKRAR